MKSIPLELSGNISISEDKDKIVITGDPEGLKSLAAMLIWLANVKQELIKEMPNGYREHIHLSPGIHISHDSSETEICRLDAKGTGEFPKTYNAA
jgi:hypothetical protein